MARRGTLSVLCLTLLALVTLGTSVGASVAAKAASTTAARLEGRIHLPQGHNGEPLSTAPVVDASVVLRGEDGRTIKTFCRRDGSFAFSAVPAGSHVLNVFALGFAFPEVTVQVGSKGVVRAAAGVQRTPLQLSLDGRLELAPIAVQQYYEKRAPVDIIGYIKTPYGMMIAFSVAMMFVLPMMKVDPEEYQQMQAQLRGGGGGSAGGSGAQQQAPRAAAIRDKKE